MPWSIRGPSGLHTRPAGDRSGSGDRILCLWGDTTPCKPSPPVSTSAPDNSSCSDVAARPYYRSPPSTTPSPSTQALRLPRRAQLRRPRLPRGDRPLGRTRHAPPRHPRHGRQPALRLGLCQGPAPALEVRRPRFLSGPMGDGLRADPDHQASA